MKRRMKLQRVTGGNSTDNWETSLSYRVEHDNGKTTAFQDLEIIIDRFGKATAKMNFEDMEPQESTDEALDKLADWMERMAVAIRERTEKTDFKIFQ